MAKKETFETALQRLEQAVADLEQGDLPLDQSLSRFEEGVKYAAQCQKILQQVQTRVELLQKSRSGALSTVPFEGGTEEE